MTWHEHLVLVIGEGPDPLGKVSKGVDFCEGDSVPDLALVAGRGDVREASRRCVD